jgi:hypothetical protein
LTLPIISPKSDFFAEERLRLTIFRQKAILFRRKAITSPFSSPFLRQKAIPFRQRAITSPFSLPFLRHFFDKERFHFAKERFYFAEEQFLRQRAMMECKFRQLTK